MKQKVFKAQSCPTLSDSMDCSPPGSSVHGILQAKILEWVAIPFSRGSSWPRDQTWVSCIACRFFTIWATREVLNAISQSQKDKYCIVPSLFIYEALGSSQTYTNRKLNGDCQGLREGGNGELFNENSFSFARWESPGGGWWWWLHNKNVLNAAELFT